MSSVNIIVSHRGKKHDVEVDLESTGEVFKYQLFSLTAVEPDRQRILVKGGQLKDEVVMGSLGLKAGQTIMMMGTPGDSGADLRRPEQQVKFVEDMTEAEAARQEGATPAGLENLGNTCYLNSTLQTLRAIPELQDALSTYEFKSSGPLDLMPQLDLTGQLRSLYKAMAETQWGYAPHTFLQALRRAFPQFAERAKNGHGYAQQDAEEAWSQIVAQLRQKLEINKRQENDTAAANLVDRYMAGEFTSVLECDEKEARDAGEQAVTTTEPFLKLNCHIDKETNHLRDGILAALTETIEKRSSALDREAVYSKKSKISRLPKYLTVHFVRFFWKREVQKKAKIMRKVTFPHELDVVEFCVDDLKKLLVPVRDKVREVRKDEEDMERARKRRKKNPLLDGGDESAEQPPASKDKDDKKGKGAASSGDGDVDMTAGETYKTDAEIEAEKEAALLQAKRELYSLISQDAEAHEGENRSGLYELRGVVTHQGASADSGHYTAYVKKTAPVDPTTGKHKGSEDGNWWWFNDDKVSEVTADKIDALAGGGESHSALILLYKAIDLPTAEDVAEAKK